VKGRLWLGLLWVGFCQSLCAAESLEVRAYLAPVAGIYDLVLEGNGILDEEKRIDVSKLEKLEEDPFESRFFNEGDELRDLTAWAREMYLVGDGGDQVVWNENVTTQVFKKA